MKFIFLLTFLVLSFFNSDSSFSQCTAEYKVYTSTGVPIGDWEITPKGIKRKNCIPGNDYFIPVNQIEHIYWDKDYVYFIVNGRIKNETFLHPTEEMVEEIYNEVIRILYNCP